MIFCDKFNVLMLSTMYGFLKQNHRLFLIIIMVKLVSIYQIKCVFIILILIKPQNDTK